MSKKSTKELENALGSTHVSEFEKFYHENKENMNMDADSFSVYIKDLLREKGLTQQKVFLMADIPERYGYKLLSGEKHTKQRDVILRICYASECTLEETQKALRKYESGGLILTDDKAPVELLGIKVIDELISDELGYYKRIFKSN